MISIITPSFNQGKYIERTIQSVLSQNISKLEYLVVDGGSTDETLDILKRYKKTHCENTQHFHYISEPDDGQTHAINKGLSRVSGDIIGWLNSDDVYCPGALAYVEDYFKKHPEVDVVYGQANYIDEYDQFLKPYPTEQWNLKRLKQICYLAQPAVFLRRHVVERFGLLDETLQYCMDYEYWLRLALQGVTFVHVSKLLAGYRLYAGTKTVAKSAEMQLESILMLRKKLGYVPNSWLIYYAVGLVQHKTLLRMPRWRYVLMLYLVGAYKSFYWNGFFKGLLSLFTLPKAMLEFRRGR